MIRRRRRHGFTLVEMLVIVAIIAVLIALLLPVISRARQMAVRAACLSDRRHNAIQFTTYASDHNQYFMGPDHFHHMDPYNGSITGNKRGAGRPYPLGTLAVSGYVEDPSTLFCPGFVRPRPDFRASQLTRWYYDQPEYLATLARSQSVPWQVNGRFWRSNFNPNYWRERVTQDGGSMVMTGIAHYLHAYWAPEGSAVNPTYNGKSASHFFGSRIRLDHLATRWRDKIPIYGSYSPVIVSCADYGKQMGRKYAHTALTPWDRTSHQRRGVNGAFYDGSARWFAYEEYYDGIHSNVGRTTAHWSMQRWFRHYASF